jgi:hypothetical protein
LVYASGVRFQAQTTLNRSQEGILMVSNCANPECGKPLHYLRDGRVFLFRAAESAAGSIAAASRRFEHFWLCGACAQRMTLVQDALGIHLLDRAVVALDPGEIPED